MEQTLYATLGDSLLESGRTRTPIPALTAQHPDLTVEDAYRVQLHQVDSWIAQGRRVIGFKVGLTSKAMQRMLKVDSPDFGHLFDDMLLDPVQPIDIDRFISPRIEPEISFVLKRDLTGPGLTVVDAIAAIDYAVASIEVIDSRIADWKIGLADTIADNASSGALILGTRSIRLDEVDLSLLGSVVTKNGTVVSTGAGGAVLGHPVNGLLWLANQLGTLGRSLPSGSIIMAGSMSGAVPVAPGDRITATFARLGTVSARFASDKETS
ncbi:fumarylacetoacetate hydrolase family protein [Microbacterium sp. ARD31]|uniref:2-keto-4-pentenoate hydratase n=1 Tax=Microbacterium sp. ARD31 TaxID=2962576 RepID=UPI00288128A9|nr:fumarylacetoacetate hydrolase family protein [Microbacterium sp. ARD31]MDT0183974.1 fumarylacetoacetate hydrolase family protein [Microbacterium sp. ARD31]